MSRARNIKPGFFKNELLVELPFEYRLLFVGLWTMCDRAGRMEDRPTKIRMELFPADSVDVDSGLRALHDSGFIQRYEVAGKRYLQVLAWSKHQNPHVKEAASVIPPISELPAPAKAAESKVAPVEHGASTVQAPEGNGEGTGLAGLIPDSLIPDSSSTATEPNGSGASAPLAEHAKAADPLWHTGLAFLKRKGVPEKQARGYLGKLKGQVGDITAAGLLAQAEAEDVTDPVPWLSRAAMVAGNKPRGSPEKPSAAANFSGITYTGTALEDMPDDLRPEISDHAA